MTKKHFIAARVNEKINNALEEIKTSRKVNTSKAISLALFYYAKRIAKKSAPIDPQTL